MKNQYNENQSRSKGPYDDIIDLPHPTSKKHPRMPLYNRAAQFSPFAALTGHEAAVEETARLTESWQEISEDQAARLNEKLQQISENIACHPQVTITYFVPDQKKAGGRYASCSGRVKKINAYEGLLLMEDQTVIDIHQISEISDISGIAPLA